MKYKLIIINIRNIYSTESNCEVSETVELLLNTKTIFDNLNQTFIK